MKHYKVTAEIDYGEIDDTHCAQQISFYMSSKNGTTFGHIANIVNNKISKQNPNMEIINMEIVIEEEHESLVLK